MAIERVKIRARVEIEGSSLNVSTPFVQSFSVRKQRGQISTFDASLKVSHEEVDGPITGVWVKIYAGTESTIELIFTGVCRSAKISPCYDDPKYVILSIAGSDILANLQNRKYTRRCRSSQAAWVEITNVTREGLRTGKFSKEYGTIQFEGGDTFGKDGSLVGSTTTANVERNKTSTPNNSHIANSPDISVIIENVGSS